MKVLDPQSALLTNAEVFEFLRSNKARPADKQVGAYEHIKLKDYNDVRQDFDRYVKLTAPHIAACPPPDAYMLNVSKLLQRYGLTKTEALMILNLGVGLDRAELPNDAAELAGEPTPQHSGSSQAVQSIEQAAVPEVPPTSPSEPSNDSSSLELSDGYHRYVLTCIIEDFEDRFAGEDGETKVEEILKVLNDSIRFPNV